MRNVFTMNTKKGIEKTLQVMGMSLTLIVVMVS